MDCIKQSFGGALIAGYDLIHVATTVDIFKKDLDIETIVDRTVELIHHIEKFRQNKGFSRASIEHVWPSFIVGKVGTDLNTTYFSSIMAAEPVKIATDNNSKLKGHYTDFVKNPEEYSRVGVGAANVWLEFTSLEYGVSWSLLKLKKNYILKIG
jgi:D-tagatose-1,6-bisphosphate aldolase subunit GatZ/KbaZ